MDRCVISKAGHKATVLVGIHDINKSTEIETMIIDTLKNKVGQACLLLIKKTAYAP